MIRRFLRWLPSLCGHPHTYRERIKGSLVFTCEDCGRSFPLNVTDKAKAKRLSQRLQASRYPRTVDVSSSAYARDSVSILKHPPRVPTLADENTVSSKVTTLRRSAT